ncbi:MAG: hypothetical protein HUU11_09490 [Anaerolineales bacterium]|nr:hypothetical protein [Anaerolineales bacterium]
MNPAIVIAAYNRPHALQRLLASLHAADYPAGVSIPLIISIDSEEGRPNPAVRETAEGFTWKHGSKEIILHRDHLGLLQNFSFCGGLSMQYGSVVFLEDDLVVSPVFYHYAFQALRRFEADSHIAGISLHRYAFNGYNHLPFEPLSDSSDGFFMQVPSILGQAWNKAQWEEFTQWRGASSQVPNEALHDVWSQFDADDYFPILTKYLISTQRFYVFPRTSLTSGFGDAGTHFARGTSYFQVPLQYEKTSFQFTALEDSNAVYDSFMEILPRCLQRLAPALRSLPFDVDLNAVKQPRHLQADFVLTTRACRNPLKTFALAVRPPEANLVFEAEGQGISLCRTADLLWDTWSELATNKKLFDYASRAPFSLRQVLLHRLIGWLRGSTL